MLVVLKKLVDGSGDLSPKELAFLAERYFTYFAEQQRPDILEKLLPYIPANNQERLISHAITDICYNLLKHPDTGTLKYLFGKAEEIGASQAFWDNLVDDNDYRIRYVSATGSEENVDLFLDHIKRHAGSDRLSEVLPYTDTLHISMIDKIMKHCHEVGGEALVKKFIRCSPLSAQRIIDDGHAPERSVEGKIKAVSHLLQKQYEIGGVSAVIESVDEMYEIYDNDKAKQAVISGALTSLMTTGGNELVIDVLSHDNYKFAWLFAHDGAAEVMQTIEDLMEQTQDQDHIRGVRNLITNGWWQGARFVEWADIYLDQKESLTAEEKEQLLIGLEILAMNHKIKPYTVGEGALFDTVLKAVLEDGNYAQFKKLVDIYQLFEGKDIRPEAMPYFGQLILGKNRAGFFEELADTAVQHYGYNYVENLIVAENLEMPSGIAIERGWAALLASNAEDAEKYLGVCERIGGKKLIDRIVLGSDGEYPFTVLSLLGLHRLGLVSHLLDRASPEVKSDFIQTVPGWPEALESKAANRKFLLSLGSDNHRWKAVTGEDAPDEILEKYSPYKFKRALYDAILPAITVAAVQEGQPKSAPIYAYKLATLFSSEEEVETHLGRFADTWGKDSAHLMHDACNFDLPVRGEWSVKKWKNLVKKHGPEIYPVLNSAALIEERMGGKEFPDSLEKLNAYIDRTYVYKRNKENPKLAALAAKYRLPEEKFDELLGFATLNGKTCDYMPSVSIDGTVLGFPDIYMERLPPDDLRGYFLGHYSNSCQSVGNNGEPCALHGMSNLYSGFYLWRMKTDGHITNHDDIIAQSWAWIGDDNTLVFDSFERQSSDCNVLVQPFLEQFAHEVIGKHVINDGSGQTIASISLGCDPSGQTPPLALPKLRYPSAPRDYDGKYDDNTDARDSAAQYKITPVDHQLTPQVRLEPARLAKEVDDLGLAYIESIEEKFRKNHNIAVGASIGVQFYMEVEKKLRIGDEQLKSINEDLSAISPDLAVELDRDVENREQYRLISTCKSMSESLRLLEQARELLKATTKKYGLNSIHFHPRPYKGKEWSEASISIEMEYPKDVTMPMHDAFEVNLSACARWAFLAYAQHDVDYARFWNSDKAPDNISAGSEPSDSIRLSATGTVLSVECRLANSGSNLIAATVATLAGIDHALVNPVSEARMMYPIPTTRYEAIGQMREALDAGIFEEEAQLALAAILGQHETVYRQRPAPDVKNSNALVELIV